MAEGEDTLDSWEDLEDSGELDKRLQEIKTKSKDSPISTSMPVVNLQEDSSRTAYQPQVKILKRQANGPADNHNNRSGGLSKPFKTLQQREAEYAEARMRIMGSGPSGDETVNSSAPDRPSRLIQQVENMKVTDNVVRLPKGPDGSKGFAARR